ncbi:MAG: threonine synthase [Acidimicrobiia bacterium]
MKYVSTRGEAPELDFRGVLLAGLASDGGLYVPDETPMLPDGWEDWSYQQSITGSLSLFGAEDVAAVVGEAATRFSRPETAPLVEVGDRMVFELFWGPTLSFKDHALQVLARLFDRELSSPATVLGATSGDTGSAAIEACRGRANLRIVILYPDGKVSEFQRRQMTTVEDENVMAVAVDGTFDDCQAMVKSAFLRHEGLLAFNSINWARIAAQAGYYIYLAARIGQPFDVVVPTGNFGNVFSSWLARRMGAPIETITIANNTNHGLANLINTGAMGDGEVEATLAPAMDVAVPSNLERLTGDPSIEFRAGFADDDQIRETISEVDRRHGYLLDPHTAAAWFVGDQTAGDRIQVVVGTAHPGKFVDAVEQAVGRRPDPPLGFEVLADKPERSIRIADDPSELDRLIH